jgi:hypothetical protein
MHELGAQIPPSVRQDEFIFYGRPGHGTSRYFAGFSTNYIIIDEITEFYQELMPS